MFSNRLSNPRGIQTHRCQLFFSSPVLNIVIWQTQLQQPHRTIQIQGLAYRAARSASHDVVLDGYQQTMGPCHLVQTFDVQRLDEAHVDQRCVQFLGDRSHLIQ